MFEVKRTTSRRFAKEQNNRRTVGQIRLEERLCNYNLVVPQVDQVCLSSLELQKLLVLVVLNILIPVVSVAKID